LPASNAKIIWLLVTERRQKDFINAPTIPSTGERKGDNFYVYPTT
jgi:hypothetical protein